MQQTVRSRIASFGSCFPEKELTNVDLEKFVDTSDQWISERTGIRARRVLSEGENNSDIAAKACLQAIERAGIKPEEVDLILGCTTTPDRWMPSLASTVQAKIGATQCAAAYDVLSACAGWMTGLQIADSFVRTGQYKNVLVIGSEALSRFINSCSPANRATPAKSSISACAPTAATAITSIFPAAAASFPRALIPWPRASSISG
jgi:3-oxoacyl-[acyl-carrier-protein] synthase III